MDATTNKSNMPASRPYNSYQLFFILERELLLNSRLGKRTPEEYEQNFSGYEGLDVPPLPPRYRHLGGTLHRHWYVPGKKRVVKRKHAKSHGVASFREIPKVVADNWRSIDPTTKRFIEGVARSLKERHAQFPKGSKEVAEDTPKKGEEGALTALARDDAATKDLASMGAAAAIGPSANATAALLGDTTQNWRQLDFQEISRGAVARNAPSSAPDTMMAPSANAAFNQHQLRCQMEAFRAFMSDAATSLQGNGTMPELIGENLRLKGSENHTQLFPTQQALSLATPSLMCDVGGLSLPKADPWGKCDSGHSPIHGARRLSVPKATSSSTMGASGTSLMNHTGRMGPLPVRGTRSLSTSAAISSSTIYGSGPSSMHQTTDMGLSPKHYARSLSAPEAISSASTNGSKPSLMHRAAGMGHLPMHDARDLSGTKRLSLPENAVPPSATDLGLGTSFDEEIENFPGLDGIEDCMPGGASRRGVLDVPPAPEAATMPPPMPRARRSSMPPLNSARTDASKAAGLPSCRIRPNNGLLERDDDLLDRDHVILCRGIPSGPSKVPGAAPLHNWTASGDDFNGGLPLHNHEVDMSNEDIRMMFLTG